MDINSNESLLLSGSNCNAQCAHCTIDDRSKHSTAGQMYFPNMARGIPVRPEQNCLPACVCVQMHTSYRMPNIYLHMLTRRFLLGCVYISGLATSQAQEAMIFKHKWRSNSNGSSLPVPSGAFDLAWCLATRSSASRFRRGSVLAFSSRPSKSQRALSWITSPPIVSRSGKIPSPPTMISNLSKRPSNFMAHEEAVKHFLRTPC